MKNYTFPLWLKCFLILISFSTSVIAQDKEDEALEIDSSYIQEIKNMMDFDKTIVYQKDSVPLNSDINLSIPKGYKFMNKADAEKLVFDFWQNPRSEGMLGILVTEDYNILSDNWAFVLSYEESGYVKDEDAHKINYDDLMKDIQESQVEENKMRKEQGYESVSILGWATKPYYDEKNNILHWAKSMQFGGQSDTTLNYDVRILGRRGLLSMNAVGTFAQLEDIKKHVPDIIHIAKFKKGSAYEDFDPSIDKVAAYTIGGLVAGKLLAKAGIFALLLKNIKLILLGAAAIFGGFRKKIAAMFGLGPKE